MVMSVSPPPPKSLRGQGGAGTWVPIGGRFRGLPGTGGSTETANTCVNDMQIFNAPSIPGCSIKALRVGFAGWDQSLIGEVDRAVSVTNGACALIIPGVAIVTAYNSQTIAPNSGTITFSGNPQYPVNGLSVGQAVTCNAAGVIAAGTYITAVQWTYVGTSTGLAGCTVTLSTPTTNTSSIGTGSSAVAFNFYGEVYPFTFGGRRANLCVDPRRDFVFSDPLPISIPCDGRQIVFKTAAQFSAPVCQISDFPTGQNTSLTTRLVTASGGLQESSLRTTSYADGTVSAVAPAGNSGGGYWGPHLILAQLSAPQPSVVVIGDSIAQGCGGNPDATGRQGYVPQSLAAAVPWYTLARGQTTACEAVQAEVGSRGFHAAAYHCSATDVLILLGRNDVAAASRTAAQIKSDIASLAAPYLAEGVRVRVATIPPTTISTDSWTSAANQAWPLANTALSQPAAAGATTLTVTSAAGMAVGQAIAVYSSGTYGAISGYFASNTTASVASGTQLNLSAATTAALAAGTTLSVGGQIVTLTQAAASGSTALTVSSTAGVSTGSSIALLAGCGGFFQPGTTISAISGSTLTLSAALLNALPSGQAVIAGATTPSGLSNEVARLAYNLDLRANYLAYGYAGLIDVAAVLEVGGAAAPASQWISTAGGAYTIDGVHPNPAGHAALVAAGAIPLSAFSLV